MQNYEWVIRTVPITDLHRDPRLQARATIDEGVVADYADAMEAGAVFPPPSVFDDGERLLVVDGHHTIRAAEARKCATIEVRVTRGTLEDATLCAAGANARHGLRRTSADKRRAVAMVLASEDSGAWTDGKIAAICGVSDKLVAAVRAQLGVVADVRIDRRGRVMNVRGIGVRTAPAHAKPADSVPAATASSRGASDEGAGAVAAKHLAPIAAATSAPGDSARTTAEEAAKLLSVVADAYGKYDFEPTALREKWRQKIATLAERYSLRNIDSAIEALVEHNTRIAAERRDS